MSEIFDAKPKDDEAEKAEIEEKFKKVQAKEVRKQYYKDCMDSEGY